MLDTDVNQHPLLSRLLKRLQGDGIGAILVKGVSGSFAVMVVGALMAFGCNMLLARLLGTMQYGIYIYALTWINLLVLVCQLGLPISLLRFVSAYTAKGDWGLLRGLLSRSIMYVLLASLIIGVIAVFVIWFLYDRLGQDQVQTFWIGLLLLPLLGLTGIRSASLRGLKRVVKAGLPDSFFRPLLIIILAGGFYVINQQELHATHVMVFNLIGALVAFSIGTLWLVKALPDQVRDISSVYSAREWLKVSFPLFFSSGLYLLLRQTDILMVGAILGAQQAGIYAVASRIASLVSFVGVAFGNIVAPMISEYYSTDRHLQLQRMMTLSARSIFFSALVVSVILGVFGESILGMFGEGFIKGYILLEVLLVGHLINAFSGSGGFLMSMTKYENQQAKILGFVVVINILANAVFLLMFGIIGAAFATLMSKLIWNIIMLIFVWRKLGINPTVMARVRSV